MADWIDEATKNSKGQFRRKAERAGKTTRQYAEQVLDNPSRYDKRTRKQAQLAKTLMKVAGGRK